MRILVTGGAGNIGSVTVAHLLAKGFSLRVIDNVPAQNLEGDIADRIYNTDYRQIDIRDYEALRSTMDDIDSVVHLAALPYPIRGREAELFSINAGGTFNVFQAAANAGIKRVVCASSINFLGNGFGKRWIDVQYFPIDESHPGYTTDSYAFSKQVVEDIAHYFWRREHISSICMRYPFVYNPVWFTGKLYKASQKWAQRAYAALMALPEGERHIEANQLLAQYWEMRQKNNNGEIDFYGMTKFFNSSPGAGLMFGHDDFWSVLDVRDAAKSIASALTAAYEGCHPLYITAAHNSTGLPSRELVELFYPNVQIWKRPIKGAESLLNTEKARAMLGFEPDFGIGVEQ